MWWVAVAAVFLSFVNRHKNPVNMKFASKMKTLWSTSLVQYTLLCSGTYFTGLRHGIRVWSDRDRLGIRDEERLAKERKREREKRIV